MNPENPPGAAFSIGGEKTGKSILRIFGKNVRKIREDRKLSQEALGLEVGVDQAYVSRMENGACNMTMEFVERLAEALNVPLTQFFEPDEK